MLPRLAILLAACGGQPAPGVTHAPSLDLSDSAVQAAVERAVATLRADTRFVDIGDELHVRRASVDRLGMSHVHLEQRVDGLRVVGGEVIVHHRADGSERAMTDHLVRGLSIDTEPAVASEAAIQDAVALWPGAEQLTDAPQVELVVRQSDTGARLAWQVVLGRLDGDEPMRPSALVDAHTGEVLDTFDTMLHGGPAAPLVLAKPAPVSRLPTTTTPYDGTQPISITFGRPNTLESPGLLPFAASNGQTGGNAPVNSASTTFTDPGPGAAFWVGQRFLDFIEGRHGLFGIDGLGGPGCIDDSSGLTQVWGAYGSEAGNNASFDWFGDGCVHFTVGGVFWGTGNWASVDMILHEMYHGVEKLSARPRCTARPAPRPRRPGHGGGDGLRRVPQHAVPVDP